MLEKIQKNQLINYSQFALDVQRGLSVEKKYIFSKYFYDERGSELFNQITRHPDYYLTQCELEIIECYKQELSAIFKSNSLNVIELGPGEGLKSLILLKQLIKDSKDFTYFMIDLSSKYLNHLTQAFLNIMPDLAIRPIYKDFNEGIPYLGSKKRNVVLFLGSSIGNLNHKETETFLNKIWKSLNNGDYFLISFDLQKDLKILLQAYDDSQQITSAFNLNLLERINRELVADFQIEDFTHYATYNVYSGAMESYLISCKKQNVYSQYLNQSFNFKEFESIHVECSYKYRYSQIESFAKNSGFKIIKNFEDLKKYFVLSLWQVKK